MTGIIGKKLGMTQVFQENGQVEAVTAIEAGPCTVVRVKTEASDGYNAAQLGFGEIKTTRRGKDRKKDREKAKASFKHLREFRVDDTKGIEVGQKVDVSQFQAGDLVDITGVSKGKGFAGGVKRYHFRGGPKTHGQDDRYRAPGSVGSATTIARVFKGQRMAGHMGGDRVTIKDLRVVKADPERHLLLVKGAVPGTKNGLILIRKSSGRGK
jgi:large subunit ribosomal protein L3